MKTQKTDILILGGGLGGYEAYRDLEKLLRLKKIHKKITLIDKNDFFSFIPLIHEVAAGTIGENHNTVSIEELLCGTKHQFVQATVTAIDPTKKIVETSAGSFSYTFCIVALGSSVNYYGVNGAKEFSQPIRTQNDALALKQKLHDTFDTADEKPVTINIIGAGYTGIEIAGQIQDLARQIRRRRKPTHPIQVNIVDGAKTILGAMPEHVRNTIERVLRKHGIHIYTGSPVARVAEDTIYLENGTMIPSTLSIWSAGVLNIAETVLPKEYTEKGRLPTGPYLTHPNDESLYAIGDIACAKKKDGTLVPQLGEAAHLEGKYVALDIVNRIKKRKRFPFHFSSRGTLMPIGGNFGVAIIGPIILYGTIAWYLRRAVYLMFVPGWKNKLHILIDWALQRR